MSSEIPLYAPDITDAEVASVSEALRSGRLTLGLHLEQFEQQVASRCDRRHGVAAASESAAMHLLLCALGLGEGDGVIASPLLFSGSAHAILLTGARPQFVDVDPITLNLDPEAVEKAITPRTRAILACSTFGNPGGIDRLAAIARHHEIPLIEDAATAIGTTLNDKPVGSFGRAALFGFSAGRTVTCAEGGVIVTDDDHLADRCRAFRNHGAGTAMDPVEDQPAAFCNDTPKLGFGYRMSELHAALGQAQMRRLDAIAARRRELAMMYIDRLMTHADMILPTVDPQTVPTWPGFVVRLNDLYTARERDRIITGMHRHEVATAPALTAVHLHPVIRERLGHRPGDFPVAESAAARSIALPFHTHLDATQVELICLTLGVMLQREQLLRPES